jgi:hypothetical protein
MYDPTNIKRIIRFREPEDYTVKESKVIIDGQEYILYDKGNLSLVTPDLLAKVVEKLRSKKINCLICNGELKGRLFGGNRRKYCSPACKSKANYQRTARKLGHLPFVERRKLMLLGNK